MSQPAISAGVATRPRLGPSACGACACAAVAGRASIAASVTALRIDIADLARSGDAPALDGAHVIGLRVVIARFPCGAGRLYFAGLVGGAALQEGGPAVPAPGQA